MIELKPDIWNKFICPECKSSNVEVKDVAFPGIHILADCRCCNCNTLFYSDFPTGHALFYPVSFNKTTLNLYAADNINWFYKPLINSYSEKNNLPVEVHKKEYKKTDKIILLNCIDYLYGHVLLKLFNAQEYLERYNDFGLVVIIPRQFEWLVPDGVSEIWSVDIKLWQAKDWFVALDSFIKNELKRFSRVYLGLAFSHPEPGKIIIEKFTGTKPFDIQEFGKRSPTITFIYREDRLWTSGRISSYLAERVNQIPSAKLPRKILIFRQNKKIIKTFRLLKRMLPQANLNVVGLGTTSNFPFFINDLRKKNVDVEVEKHWCKTYSQSHLVIGIHGSNMLLPTALAAGFVELLPQSREGNILQDIARPVSNRMDFFLSRFCDEHISPSGLATMAASIIKTFPEAYIRYHSSFLEHKIYEDIGKWKTDVK